MRHVIVDVFATAAGCHHTISHTRQHCLSYYRLAYSCMFQTCIDKNTTTRSQWRIAMRECVLCSVGPLIWSHVSRLTIKHEYLTVYVLPFLFHAIISNFNFRVILYLYEKNRYTEMIKARKKKQKLGVAAMHTCCEIILLFS